MGGWGPYSGPVFDRPAGYFVIRKAGKRFPVTLAGRDRDASTDGDQGDALALVVPGDSHRLGIEGHLPVGNKDIPMMAVAEFHADGPVPVGTPLHGVGVRVPAVEIANDADVPGLGGGANEIAGDDVMRAVLTFGDAHGVR